MAKSALGKGLSALISTRPAGIRLEAEPGEKIQQVSLGSVVPSPLQPRKNFAADALNELVESIRQHGIIQPLIVRPLSEGRYELIAGERRLRAARIAGLKTVPVLLKAAGHQSSLEMALVENIQREDINPLECARAYRKLIDEFDLTQEQVADKVGKSRTSVANSVRLLRLPATILEGLGEGRITEGHARALLAFDSPAQQLAVYDQIVARGLTVREVENSSKKGSRKTPTMDVPARDPNDRALEEALGTLLGSIVRIHRSEVGGRLSIEFYSEDDLERIFEVFGFSL
jgi:ParB family chromosome partitioning protein